MAGTPGNGQRGEPFTARCGPGDRDSQRRGVPRRHRQLVALKREQLPRRRRWRWRQHQQRASSLPLAACFEPAPDIGDGWRVPPPYPDRLPLVACPAGATQDHGSCRRQLLKFPAPFRGSPRRRAGCGRRPTRSSLAIQQVLDVQPVLLERRHPRLQIPQPRPGRPQAQRRAVLPKALQRVAMLAHHLRLQRKGTLRCAAVRANTPPPSLVPVCGSAARRALPAYDRCRRRRCRRCHRRRRHLTQWRANPSPPGAPNGAALCLLAILSLNHVVDTSEEGGLLHGGRAGERGGHGARGQRRSTPTAALRHEELERHADHGLRAE
jgi:hypothetical protein